MLQPDSTMAAEGARAGMRETLRRLGSESLVYGLGQISGRAVQLLLVPVLTRALTRDVYGVADLVFAYSQFAVFVLVFGMDAALVRFFYREPNRDARRRMVSSSLAFRIAAGVLTATILTLASAPLSQQLVGSVAYRKYILIGAVTLPFTLLVLFSNDVLRVTFQPWKFIILNMVQTAVTGGLTLWLILARHLGVVGILYGRLGGDLFSALFGLVLIRLSLTRRVDFAVLRRMLVFGFPLLPGAVAYGVLSSADRYFLQRHWGVEAVGVYAVAVKFFAVVMMGVSAFSLAFFPFAHARAQSADAPRLYARVLALYIAGASLVALLVGMFAPEALALLVPLAYRGAARPALLLTFAAVAYGAYYVSCLGVQLALRTSLLGWTAAAGALVAVAANAWLTPRHGMIGAATATLLGNVTLAVTTYGASQAVYPLPFRGRRLAVLFGLALALALAAQRWAPAGAAGWIARIATAGAFIAAALGLEVWRERGSVTARARAGKA